MGRYVEGKERRERASERRCAALLLPTSLFLNLSIHPFSLSPIATASGALIGVAIPSLDMHCAVRLHPAPIVGLSPLGAAVVAVSAVGASVHAPGGLHAAVVPAPGDPDLADLTCCALEPGAAGRVVAGRAGGGLVSIDAATGGAAQTAGCAEVGTTAAAPGPRGLLAAGTPAGRLFFLDPRAGWGAVADVACHPGPVTSLAWARDLVASAGCAPGGRAGSDPQVRVWDVRALGPARPRPTTSSSASAAAATPRPMPGLHWAPRPSAGIAFHPAAPGTLLLASARGALSLADAGAGVPGRIFPIDTGGAALTACDISRTGDLAAFGSDGGYVHLWSAGGGGGSPGGAAAGGSVCGHDPLPPLPPRTPRPAHPLPPGAPLAMTPVHFADGDGGRSLSEGWGGDVDAPSSRARPPRVLPPGLLASGRRSDFLAALPNPEAGRPGEGPAAAAVRVARLRHARLRVKGGEEGGGGAGRRGGLAPTSSRHAGARPARPARPPPSALAVARRKARSLPEAYAPLSAAPAPGAAAGASARFLEVDWSAHNRTRFAGLEGGSANAYANAILQALVAFTPPLAAALAVTPPDVGSEFSLLDEAGALVRMLASNQRGACAASNLLRALRASREAAGLGLVEGQAQRSVAGGAADIVLEASKDASLVRRAQTLARFLLEQLHREAAARGGLGLGGGGGGGGGGAGGAATPPPPPPPPTDPSAPSSTVTADSIVAATFGLPFTTRTQLLGGDRRAHDRPGRAFAVELAYPPAKARPPLPPRTGTAEGAAWAAAVAEAADRLRADPAAAAAVAAAMAPPGSAGPPSADPAAPSAASAAAAAAALTPAALAAGRPAFADLLARAIRSEAVARAWFDAEVGYAPIRTTRTPCALPAVLVVCSGLRDGGSGGGGASTASTALAPPPPARADLAWWAPRVDPAAAAGAAAAMEAALAGGDAPGVAAAAAAARAAETAWLPGAVEVCADPARGTVTVRQAASVAELLAAVEAGGGAAAPPLPPQTSPPGPPPPPPLRAVYELSAVVAHVDDGGNKAAALHTSLGGGGGSDDDDDVWSDEDEDEEGGGGRGHAGASALASPTPSPSDFTPARPVPATAAPGCPTADPSPAALRAAVPAEGHLVAHVRVPQEYLHPATGIYATPPGPTAVERLERREGGSGSEEGEEGEAEEGGAAAGAGDGVAAGGAPAAPTRPPPHSGGGPSWLLINDFAVTPSEPGEAARLYGSRKAPCVLCFARVEGVEGGAGAATGAAATPPPAPPPPAALLRPRPLLTPAQFAALCAAPPIHAPVAPARPPPFTPLSLEEAPRPGDLFGLDAEFVALAPPAFAPTPAGALVETRPARLGLARVSVVRGPPPAAAATRHDALPAYTPAIDDYVRPAEPVHDYLTRWSGLRAGDLDATPANPRHLTTLKATFTKLAHLAASGAVFVGHGLAADFRMIGLAVPPAQVIDTVDLFRAPGPRARKLSLRFLAAALLDRSIQGGEHDSIEDAVAALALFAKYRELRDGGVFERTVKELYARGAATGWDPAAVGGSAAVAAAAAGLGGVRL